MRLLIPAAAAAVLLAGLTVLPRTDTPPGSARAVRPAGGAVARPSLTGGSLAPGGGVESMARKSLRDSVTEAKVILVVTALGSAPRPPENEIRFRVKRVLKGNFIQKFITTRSLTAGAEFVGRDWVVMLSADFLAGKHSYAGHYSIKVERDVKAILAKGAG